MRFEDGPALVTHVTFKSNRATRSGGAMGSCLGAFAELSDCVVIGNRADTRGGGYSNGSQASITRCTFAGNRAPQGGAFFCGPPEGEMVVTNTIIAMSTQGVAVYCEEPGGAPGITHCCVYGNAGGDVLCGTYYDNIFEDPLFCQYPTWDLKLDAESPCLPANNIWGEQIGEYGQGCGGAVTVEDASWGAIKAMFR